MARVIVAECKQEVSTFNPVASHFADFRIVRSAAMGDYHRGVREEVGGALQVLDAAPQLKVVPTYGASANTSGGVLTTESFARLSGDAGPASPTHGPRWQCFVKGY